MEMKNVTENGPNPFFLFLFNLMGTRFVQVHLEKSTRAFRNKITNGCGAQNCLHQQYKLQTDFTRGTMLLHLANNAVRTQIHNGLFQKQGSYRQGYGRSEVDSLLRRSRKTLATQSEVLEMLEDKKDMWFGGLEDDSPKVK